MRLRHKAAEVRFTFSTCQRKSRVQKPKAEKRSSSTGNRVFRTEVSNPIWPKKSGADAALTMTVMIKAKFSSSCLHHLPLPGQQQKAGKEKGTYPVVLDKEAAGVPMRTLRSHQHGTQTLSSMPYSDTNWLMSIYLIVLLRSNNRQ